MSVFWWIFGSAIGVGLLVFFVGMYMFRREINKSTKDDIINIVKGNLDNEKAAFSITYNEQALSRNSNVIFPLASTVKIMVAIEYARQAAEGKLNSEQLVSLEDLEVYYIPNTDGGAHQAWLSQLESTLSAVPLKEVVKGMIGYSSNANTDYVMNLVGYDKLQQLLEELNYQDHSPFYPITASLAIPAAILEENKSGKKELLESLEKMTMEEYRQLAFEIEQNWLKKPLSQKMKTQLLKELKIPVQKNWSKRLPGATAAEYADLMQKLNSKQFFSREVHHYLNEVLELGMENPKNQEWLQHFGQKGGSTLFIFTNAMYAADLERNTAEMVIFTNGLSRVEQLKISTHFNDFQVFYLRDQSFRNKVFQEWS